MTAKKRKQIKSVEAWAYHSVGKVFPWAMPTDDVEKFYSMIDSTRDIARRVGSSATLQRAMDAKGPIRVRIVPIVASRRRKGAKP